MPKKKHLKNIGTTDREGIISNKPHYPSFCFRYLQYVSIKDCKDVNFFVKFMKRLQCLSSIEWKEIDKSHRHSFGYEPIPVDSIKVSRPSVITPEVKSLTVFRATGDNHSFIGFRDGDVFRIIFVEANFGDIYSH